MLIGFVIAASGCAGEASYASDAQWIALAEHAAPGDTFSPQEQGTQTARILSNLGYVQERRGTWRRLVRLGEQERMEAIGHDQLRNIGAVAVLSIDRNNDERPYLYDTLQSLFSELPEGSIVNVFVGGNSLAYVSPATLEEHIGATWAKQVHIMPAPEGVDEHFKTHKYSLIQKSTWNYARVLRAYHGTKHVLVFEDDVALAQRSIAHLDRALSNGDGAAAITLYNWRCEKLFGATKGPWSTVRLLTVPLPWYPRQFSGTQAMAFPAPVAKDLGNYLMLRAGKKPYDLLMDDYLRAREMHLANTEPSLAQHMGVKTTGLGYHHTSSCFQPILPPL